MNIKLEQNRKNVHFQIKRMKIRKALFVYSFKKSFDLKNILIRIIQCGKSVIKILFNNDDSVF